MKNIKIGILAFSLISFGTMNAQSKTHIEDHPKERKSAEEIFAKKDYNSDGFIDRTEFLKAAEIKRERAAAKGVQYKKIDLDKKFITTDTNKDAKISLEEFKLEYQKRMDNKNNPKRAFEKTDANSNGLVDYAEFEIAMKKKAARAQENGKEPRNLDPKKAFAKMDVNHDGNISFEEFETAKKVMQKRRAEKQNAPR